MTSLKASLSVIFVVRNSLEMAVTALHALAASVEQAEYNRPVQTVIIDDGSTDPQVRNLLTSIDGATLLRNESRLGVTRSYDLGLQACTGDIVWMSTDDACTGVDTLESLCQALERNPDRAVALPGSPRPGAFATQRVVLQQVLARITAPSFASYMGYATDVINAIGSLHSPPLVVDTPFSYTPAQPYVRTLQATECGRPFRVAHPEAVRVGVHSTIGTSGCFQTYLPSDRIEIGHYCAIADDVVFVHTGPSWNEELVDQQGNGRVFRGAVTHAAHLPSISSFPRVFPDTDQETIPYEGYSSKPLRIGSDVWIGHGARIVGQVTIGDGAIVAAGSVVLSDVPAYAVVAGNPAKVVRYRFSKAIIAAMQRVAWWNWSLDKVAAESRWLQTPIADFVERFDPGTSDTNETRPDDELASVS